MIGGRKPKYPARVGAGPIDDGGFRIGTEIPSAQQPERAIARIQNGGGVATGVAGVVPDHLQWTPGYTMVEGATQNQIDISGIGGGIFPAFGKGQERTIGGTNQCGNAKGMIPVLTGNKNRAFAELRRG